MKTDFWRAAKLLLAQILNLDINEQLAREVDYLKTESQVLKSQLKETGKRLKFTDEQRRQLVIKNPSFFATLRYQKKMVGDEGLEPPTPWV